MGWFGFKVRLFNDLGADTSAENLINKKMKFNDDWKTMYYDCIWCNKTGLKNDKKCTSCGGLGKL